MSSKIELISESMNASQLNLAVGVQEKEIARIEAETIGWKWSVRQKDMLHILGARALYVAKGNKLEPLTVGKFESTFVDQWGVTLPAIQGDIKSLIDADMIEKPFINGSKRTKSVQMTEHGFSLWREYANKRAALIYVMHDALNQKGDLPKSWRSIISTWVSSLLGDKARAASVGVLFLTLSAMSNEAKAEFVSPNFANAIANVEVWKTGKQSYLETPLVAYRATYHPDVDNTMLANVNTDWSATWNLPQQDDSLMLPYSSSYQIADREGAYDALLPKAVASLDMSWITQQGLKSEFTDPSSVNTDWSATWNLPQQDDSLMLPHSSSYQIADREDVYNDLLPKVMAGMMVNYMQ